MTSKTSPFFELKLSSLKRQNWNVLAVKLFRFTCIFFAIPLHITKAKKAHAIGEILLKPCMLESAKLMLREKACQIRKRISLSNEIIKSRIHEMSAIYSRVT